jgi:glycosyltransferase involved in cell wall biosynthesis
MRALLLSDTIPPENRGGAGEVAWRFAGFLRDAGHDVHVITSTQQPNANFKQAEREGIMTYALPSHVPDRWRAYLSLYNPQTVPTLERLMQNIKPDWVNAHNVHHHLSYYSLTLAHKMGYRITFTSHDVMPFAYGKLMFAPTQGCDLTTEAYRTRPLDQMKAHRLRYNPFRNAVIRHVLKHHTHDRIAVSSAHAHALHANNLPPFRVVHNSIRAQDWQPSAQGVAHLRAELGLEGRKVILFGGRLSEAKGTRQLLDALHLVRQHVPSVTLLVLSATPIEAQVQEARDAILRERYIVSAGWQQGQALVNAYSLADVVVTPSIYQDPFPTMNLEAMAVGKPVITTCYGGGKEAVENGASGFVVNPYHTTDFANALIRLLSDSALSDRMGRAGKARVETHFTPARMVADYLTGL